VQANCIDSTAAAEAVFASEVEKLKKEKIKPQEQITLEPYERDHAVVTGIYRSAAFAVFTVLLNVLWMTLVSSLVVYFVSLVLNILKN